MQYCLKSGVMFNISHMLLCLYFKVYLSENVCLRNRNMIRNKNVPLVEQILPTLPGHTSSPHRFKWGSCYSIVCLMCMLCRSLLSFCTFSLGHCVVCSSSTYRFWLPLCFRQTLLSLKPFHDFEIKSDIDVPCHL